MQNLYSAWNRVKALLFPTIPCLLALTIISVYTLGIFPRLTPEAVNLACLFLISLKLIPGISEHINVKKAESFTLALIISTAALGLALEWTIPCPLEIATVWAVVWGGLFMLSFTCLATVLVRLLRWTQLDWEKFREATQVHRNKRKEARQERQEKVRAAKNCYKDDAVTLRRQRFKKCKSYWAERLDAWKTYRKERADILHNCRKERIQNEEKLRNLRLQYEVKQEEAQQEHEAKLAEFQREHENQLDEVRRKHEAKLAELQRGHESQLDEVRRKHEADLAQTQQEYVSELAQTQRENPSKSIMHNDGRDQTPSNVEEADSKKPGKVHDHWLIDWIKAGFIKLYESRLIDWIITGLILVLFLTVLYVFPLILTNETAGVDYSGADVTQQGDVANNQERSADTQDSRSSIEQWIQAVEQLMSRPKDLDGGTDQAGDSSESDQILLTVLTYVALVAIGLISLLLFFYILYAYIRKIRLGKHALPAGTDDSERFNFLDAYAIPIALLLISILGLYALSSGKSGILTISNGWGTLAVAVLFILLLLTAFEMVRLTLEECGHSDSLLKRLLKMVFIAILEFLVQIVFGVLKGLQIENLITSLLTVVVPEDKDGLPAYILRKLQKMFRNEVNKVCGTRDSSFETFYKRRIWKKGGP